MKPWRRIVSAVLVGLVLSWVSAPWLGVPRTAPSDAVMRIASVNGLERREAGRLRAAILDEFGRRGYVEPAPLATRATYAIDITVVIGAEEDGVVPVSIFWLVFDGTRRIGLVEQSNRLPADLEPNDLFGHIAGSGVTAGVGGVLKLVPRS